VDPALLAILCCPFCRVALTEAEGRLDCPSCHRRFPIENGIPLLLHPDLPGAREKLGEMAGWVEKARAEGWYEPDDTVDAVLPYINRELGWDDPEWHSTAHSFWVMFDRYVGEARGLRVLEVGAAKGWAAPHWREQRCEYVATDILVDGNIGLGRGAFYGDFGRVQADAEHLPFVNGAFDITYCCAALHHALDQRTMVREMARVTKPGGLVAALNEGTRGLLRSADNPAQADEKALGINEHVHPVLAYLASFRRAGCVVRRIQRADGWPPVPYGGLLARVPKVGSSLGTIVHLSAARYGSVSIYEFKRG
jgi:uncharacterized protein YbaR (Trm112 family)/SAM-dependent methyltransferase